MTWIHCPSPIVADVIRWHEPIWAAPTKKRGKPDQIGEQVVTAEVKALGDFLQLQVRTVEVLSLDDGAKPPPGVKVGDSLRRKKSTIDRGDCHRLLWSDESARAP
ncbi:MAG: hypothetical protein K8R48_05700 [Alphaproteobacteria bacterium]|nr:hypothetical protein [Alphaproteobacteria bacterium]